MTKTTTKNMAIVLTDQELAYSLIPIDDFKDLHDAAFQAI